MSDNDPRVFFAAERTLLAWIRTGLGLVAMGFVVARFGLFMRIIHPDTHGPEHVWSAPMGIGLALLGSLVSLTSTLQHRRFCGTLPEKDLPARYSLLPGTILGFGASIVGLILSVLLL